MIELVLQTSSKRISLSINDSGSFGYPYGKNEIGCQRLTKPLVKSSSELKIEL